ncbi:MAG: AraC family transcriptional regulator N-terminal domain-containing protein [Haliscomenobacter sp.]|nr:AraC family transcriptional regulator N-terminal domain-containing protein [Haliscomenobacter sp.]
MELPKKFYARQVLIDPIENRTVFCLPEAELSIYETRTNAHGVEFQFACPMLACMIAGKKVMHLQHKAFDFVPGESSFLLPEKRCVSIFRKLLWKPQRNVSNWPSATT